MSDTNPDPNKQKNRYIFAGTGAVLGAVAGFGAAGAIAALGGAALGGLLGYQLLTRIGSQKS
jgi:osmotically inducible lipoprotein OsmB